MGHLGCHLSLMAPSSNSPNRQNSKNSGKKVNSEETAGGTDRGKTLFGGGDYKYEYDIISESSVQGKMFVCMEISGV